MTVPADEQPFEVVLTSQVEAYLGSLTNAKEYGRCMGVLRMLETFPEAGGVYDPDYYAVRPTEPCRVLYAGHSAFYYAADIEAHRVKVVYAEDQRVDPEGLERFSDAAS